MREPFQIRFVPDGLSHTASAPVELFLAAAACGIVLEQPCGLRGTCGRCRVRVVAGDMPAAEEDRRLLSDGDLRDGWRLACRLVVDRSVTIEIPPSVRSLAGKSFGGDLPFEAGRIPIIAARTIEIPGASLACQEEDLDRAASALGFARRGLHASPPVLTALSEVMGRKGPVRLVIHENEVVAASAAIGRPLLGAAVDIGSTSLAAALVDLDDGHVVASDSRLNPQVACGVDVISRIHYAAERPDGLRRLTAAVRDGLGTLLRDLLAAAACEPGDVVAAAFAGNPTMIHTWLGVPVAPLGTSPYVGAWSGELGCRARDVALPIHPEAPVYVFPMVRSHVGSDAVAAAIACDLDGAAPRTLLIDLGTNTEVMVVSGGRLAATSAAAGPAFEGATITHGMRAAPGAIDAVTIAPDGRLAYKTIGNSPARGLCGSGLIDAVAGLLRVGAISLSGRLRLPRGEEVPLPAALADRLTSDEGQSAFVLARGGETSAGRDITLTAKDVRQLQLVKGSIAAAATILCRRLGFEPAGLGAILMAGAFGNYVRKSSALAIGLVPSIDPERVRFVGNAAGVGARMALCDRRVRDRARALAESAEYVELGDHPGYQQLFLDALAFPADAGPVGSGGPSLTVSQ